MTTAEFNKIINEIIENILKMRDAGQKEYAHDENQVFRNFIDTGKKINLTKEQVLFIFATKHYDGIAAYIKGHKSQRENVKGRIIDLMVYMCLFYAMVVEGERDDKMKQNINVMPTQFENPKIRETVRSDLDQ